MPEIEVVAEFEVYCAKCGASLDDEAEVSQRHGYATRLTVTPCPKCMQTKDDEIEDLSDQVGSLEYTITERDDRIRELEVLVTELRKEAEEKGNA